MSEDVKKHIADMTAFPGSFHGAGNLKPYDPNAPVEPASDEVVDRASILPLGRTAAGKVVPAVPNLLATHPTFRGDNGDDSGLLTGPARGSPNSMSDRAHNTTAGFSIPAALKAAYDSAAAMAGDQLAYWRGDYGKDNEKTAIGEDGRLYWKGTDRLAQQSDPGGIEPFIAVAGATGLNSVTGGLMASGSKAMTPIASSAAHAKPNMTPFYGPDVGPKGRIPDPAAAARALELQSGLPGAPVEGFFNPAAGALMQEGVSPKQTITYFEKQMGSRGGKLPPGQWEQVKRDLGITSPDQVVDRDAVVKAIDARAPRQDVKRFKDVDDDEMDRALERAREREGESAANKYEVTQGDDGLWYHDAFGNGSGGFRSHPAALGDLNDVIRYDVDRLNNRELKELHPGLFRDLGDGPAQYQDYITDSRNLDNYQEAVVGYADPTSSRQVAGHTRKNMVQPWDDGIHFTDHPNQEGWYRTQDAAQRVPKPQSHPEMQAWQRDQQAFTADKAVELQDLTREQQALRNKLNKASNDVTISEMERLKPLMSSPDPKIATEARAQYRNLDTAYYSPFGMKDEVIRHADVTDRVNELGDLKHKSLRNVPFDTEKTRVVDEVQPQRYQKMRDFGARASDDRVADLMDASRRAGNELKQAKHDAAVALGIEPEFVRDIPNIKAFIAETAKNNPQAKQYYDRIIQLEDAHRHAQSQEAAAKKGVPASPFSHDVNAATGLLSKHLLRDAASDNIDRVAWTPGEVQADRYGKLLEDVRGIQYNPSNGGHLWTKNPHGEWLHVERNLPPEKLAEYVGKEQADALLRSPMVDAGMGSKAHQIEFPKGMTLGADGMVGFYGDGTTPGIFGAQVQSQLRKLGQGNTGISPFVVEERSVHGKYPAVEYPSVPLDPATRDVIKRTGLSLYSNPKEATPAATMLANMASRRKSDHDDKADKKATGGTVTMNKSDRRKIISRALDVVRRAAGGSVPGFADGGDTAKAVLSESTRSPVPDWLLDQQRSVRDGMPMPEGVERRFPSAPFEPFADVAGVGAELTGVPSMVRGYGNLTDEAGDGWTKAKGVGEMAVGAMPLAGATVRGAQAMAPFFATGARGAATMTGLAVPGMAEMVAHTGSAHAAGLSPKEVRELQAEMKLKGYYSGPVDGDLGPGTQRAIKAYREDQEKHATQKAEETRQAQQMEQSRAASATATAQAKDAEARAAETKRKSDAEALAEKRRTEGEEKLRNIENDVPWYRRAVRDYGQVAGLGAGAILGGYGAAKIGKLFDAAATSKMTRANQLLGEDFAKLAPNDKAARINQFWAEGQPRPLYGSRDVPYTSDKGKLQANTDAPAATELYLPSRAGQFVGNAAPMGAYGAEMYYGQEVLGKQAQQELEAARKALATDPSDVNIEAYQKAKDREGLATFVTNMGRGAGLSHGYKAISKAVAPGVPRDRPDISKAEAARFDFDASLGKGAASGTGGRGPRPTPPGPSGQAPSGPSPTSPGTSPSPSTALPPPSGAASGAPTSVGPVSASNRPSWASDPPAGVRLKKGSYWDANLNRPRQVESGQFGTMPKYSVKSAAGKKSPTKADDVVEDYAPGIPNKPPREQSDTDFGMRNRGGIVQAIDMARGYADGGAVMRAYEPTWIDRMAATVAGDDRDSVRQRLAERLFGTRGMGRTGAASLGGLTPFNHTVNAVEDVAEGDWPGAAYNGAMAVADGMLMKGVGSAARGLMPAPGSLEAVRDASMAKQLNNDVRGWKPPAFDRERKGLSTSTNEAMWKEQQFMKRHGEVVPASDVAGYIRHPGFEPSALNRAGGVNQINSNTALPPDRLRMLYPGFADGGVPGMDGADPHIPHGPVVGPDGGRDDTRPVSVPSGSFIIPADVVAGLGGGNTQAGFAELDRMFGTAETTHMATGGEVPAVPIRISDGEYVISPAKVAEIGGGDLNVGHKALDKLMIQLRQQNIKQLQSLPPPAKG